MSKTLLSLIMIILTATGCGNGFSIPESIPPVNQSAEESIASLYEENSTDNNSIVEENISQENELTVFINNTPLTVKWEDNESVSTLFQLAEQEKLTIDMEQYGGFEQVGTLPQDIIRNDEQMVTVPGDIVLYSGNSLVIFYGSNSWAYTKLGHIEGLSAEELTDILDNSEITVTLSTVSTVENE